MAEWWPWNKHNLSPPQAKNLEGWNHCISGFSISLIKTHNMSPPQAKNFKCWNLFISWSDISLIKTHNMNPQQSKISKVENFLFQDPALPLKCIIIIWARRRRKILKIESFLFQDLSFPQPPVKMISLRFLHPSLVITTS